MGFVEGWGGELWAGRTWRGCHRRSSKRVLRSIAEHRRELRDDMLAAEVTCGAMATTSTIAPKTSGFFIELVTAGHQSGCANPSEEPDWALSMAMTAAAMSLRCYNSGGFGVCNGVLVLVTAAAAS